jgi:hypothetical protein
VVKAVVLLLLLFAPFAAAGETKFVVDSPAGPIALEIRDARTMRLRLSRPTDLETSTRALEQLLAQAFSQSGLPMASMSIDVGRIVEHPWLSQLLAAAALRSSRWDAMRGAPRTGNDNLAVMQLIDDDKLLAAWVPIFGRYGVAIRNTSVEKVLVGRVGETTALRPLAQDPRAFGKRLPFDAILWLRLEALSNW